MLVKEGCNFQMFWENVSYGGCKCLYITYYIVLESPWQNDDIKMANKHKHIHHLDQERQEPQECPLSVI